MSLPAEILILILESSQPNMILPFSLLNKTWNQYINTHLQMISKLYLDKYKVDYKDPTNFIYIKNNVRENWFKIHNHYDYFKLLKLYYKFFNSSVLNCSYKLHNEYFKETEFYINRMSRTSNTPDDSDYNIQNYIIKYKNKWNDELRNVSYDYSPSNYISDTSTLPNVTK